MPNKIIIKKHGKSKQKQMSMSIGRKNDDVQTPPEILEDLKWRYDISEFFDPCPLNNTGPDGLEIDWKSPAFVNPPFSKTTEWIEKVIEQYNKGVTVFLFVPCRPSARWWNRCIDHAASLELPRGTIKFPGYNKGLGIPINLFHFNPELKETRSIVKLTPFGQREATFIQLK